MQLLHLGDHQAGLLVFAGGAVEPGPLPFGFAGEQALGVLLPGPGDDGVGQVQDGLGAAVVLLQLDEAGAGEEAGEFHDIAEIGAPEGIDALGVVPHGHDVVVGEGQQPHQVRLQEVGVLVFVHHQVLEALREAAAHVFVLAQEAAALHQQVVIVHQVIAALFLPVGHRRFWPVRPAAPGTGGSPGSAGLPGRCSC